MSEGLNRYSSVKSTILVEYENNNDERINNGKNII